MNHIQSLSVIYVPLQLILLCLLTIDDLLPLGFLLAEAGQGFRGSQLPPVWRVVLKLQEARLHLLQLWGGAGGGAWALRSQNWSLKAEERIKSEKI